MPPMDTPSCVAVALAETPAPALKVCVFETAAVTPVMVLTGAAAEPTPAVLVPRLPLASAPTVLPLTV